MSSLYNAYKTLILFKVLCSDLVMKCLTDLLIDLSIKSFVFLKEMVLLSWFPVLFENKILIYFLGQLVHWMNYGLFSWVPYPAKHIVVYFIERLANYNFLSIYKAFQNIGTLIHIFFGGNYFSWRPRLPLSSFLIYSCNSMQLYYLRYWLLNLIWNFFVDKQVNNKYYLNWKGLEVPIILFSDNILC